MRPASGRRTVATHAGKVTRHTGGIKVSCVSGPLRAAASALSSQCIKLCSRVAIDQNRGMGHVMMHFTVWRLAPVAAKLRHHNSCHAFTVALFFRFSDKAPRHQVAHWQEAAVRASIAANLWGRRVRPGRMVWRQVAAVTVLPVCRFQPSENAHRRQAADLLHCSCQSIANHVEHSQRESICDTSTHQCSFFSISECSLPALPCGTRRWWLT